MVERKRGLIARASVDDVTCHLRMETFFFGLRMLVLADFLWQRFGH